MSQDPDRDYPSTEDVLDLHHLVVESSDVTEPGVRSSGDVEYATESLGGGHFGQSPDSIHEVAFQLLRLVVANHPFVDGNKRTALSSVRVLYALNGLEFDYDRTVKEFLKALGTDESDVESDTVVDYLREHTSPLPQEYEATIAVWREHETDDPPDDSARGIVRFLGRLDLDVHADIYEELARE